MEGWRDGEMERWRDGEMERWRDGEMEWRVFGTGGESSGWRWTTMREGHWDRGWDAVRYVAVLHGSDRLAEAFRQMEGLK